MLSPQPNIKCALHYSVPLCCCALFCAIIYFHSHEREPNSILRYIEYIVLRSEHFFLPKAVTLVHSSVENPGSITNGSCCSICGNRIKSGHSRDRTRVSGCIGQCSTNWASVALATCNKTHAQMKNRETMQKTTCDARHIFVALFLFCTAAD